MNNNLAYQEDSREELIGGKVVAMSPRPTVNHSRTAGNIFNIFSNYLKGRKCEPFPDGVDLYLSDTDRYIPDGMVVCDPDKIQNDGVHGAPDLVVEVLSPSTGGYDRGRKKQVYALSGVQEYWIVSPGERSVEQYFLQNGDLALNAVYSVYPDWMLDKMEPEERDAVATDFKCSLFDDLSIRLDDIFARLI